MSYSKIFILLVTEQLQMSVLCKHMYILIYEIYTCVFINEIYT